MIPIKKFQKNKMHIESARIYKKFHYSKRNSKLSINNSTEFSDCPGNLQHNEIRRQISIFSLETFICHKSVVALFDMLLRGRAEEEMRLMLCSSNVLCLPH
jgi:hypothetical protein